MKTTTSYKKILSHSIAIISLLIITFFATVPLVLAQVRTLTLSPTSGPIGTVITITGSGFTPYASYRVYFDSNGDSTYVYPEPFKTVSANATGKFITSLTVPSVPSGTYYIRADVYPYTPPALASAPFSVKTLWDKLLDIQDEIAEIEAKLDGTVSSLITTIYYKLGAFTGNDNVASLLYAIKAKTDTIVWGDITYIKSKVDSIKTEVTAIEGKLDNPTYGLSAIKTYLTGTKSAILTAIGDLEGKLDKLVAEPELMLRPEGHVIEEYSNVAHSGYWSIKFLIPTGHGQSSGHYDNPGFTNTEAIEDGQRIILLGHGLSTLDDFNNISFWYYFPYQAQLTHPIAPPETVNEWNILPYVGIFLDINGDGSADALLLTMVEYDHVTTYDAWSQHIAVDDWWAPFGTDYNGKANHNNMTFWKSQYGNASIVEIRLYWGYWAGTYAINDNIVYVDDIVINGIVTYDCERPVRAP